MSVMKTFCGCVSTKTGSLAIIGFYIVSIPTANFNFKNFCRLSLKLTVSLVRFICFCKNSAPMYVCEQEVQVTFQWLSPTPAHSTSCQDKNLSLTSSPLPPHSTLNIPSPRTNSNNKNHLCLTLCCGHIGGFQALFLGRMIL